MVFYIYAADGLYGGLHGMYQEGIEVCKDRKDAEDVGESWSYDVMNDYEDISDDIYYETQERLRYDRQGEDFEVVYNEVMADDVLFEVYELNVPDDADLGALDHELFDIGRDAFLEKYCADEKAIF